MRHAAARSLGLLLALGWLAGCAATVRPVNIESHADVVRSSEVITPPGDAVGTLGPDGGPALAERGIGGTGAPPMVQTADRGIGGTGIVGVVTGFGSVFVNGIEVRYDDSASVDIDGRASSAADLRAGQLVAILAEGPAAAPHAKTISVRSAAIGRIEALELGSGALTIGGQAVSVPRDTWGANRFGLGDWVKVSGLLRPDGVIVASRLDAAPAGFLSARGRVARNGSVVRVGNLIVPEAAAAGLTDGQFVVASGTYEGNHGHVSAVAPDTLFADTAAYFGASTRHLSMQAFVHADRGGISINGAQVGAEAAVSGQATHDGIAVVTLERGANGSYTAVGLHYAGYRTEPAISFRRRQGPKSGNATQTAQLGVQQAAPSSSQPADVDNGSSTAGHLTTASIANLSDSATGSSTSAAAISRVASQPGLFPAVIPPNPSVPPPTVTSPVVAVPIVTPPVSEAAAVSPATVNPVAEAPQSASTGPTQPSVTTPSTAGSVAPPTLPPMSKTLPSSTAALPGSAGRPTIAQLTGAGATGSTTPSSGSWLGSALAHNSTPAVGTKSGSAVVSGFKPTGH